MNEKAKINNFWEKKLYGVWPKEPANWRKCFKNVDFSRRGWAVEVCTTIFFILAHCVVWKNTLCSFSFSWIFLPSWMNECVHVQCETMSKISMKLKFHLKSYLIYHHIRNWFREPHFLKVFFYKKSFKSPLKIDF